MIPEDYWPADVHIIAKDILRFHCVIWPGMLLAAGYDLPKQILSHGFLTVEGKKISKSLGNVIDPVYLADQYSTDAVRYYLIREKTLGQDGDFSEEELVTKFNSELADAFGNFVHRTLTFIENHFDGKVPEGEIDSDFADDIQNKVEEIENLMDNTEVNQALEKIVSLTHQGNEYFQECEPWNSNSEEASNCLFNCVNLVNTLATLFYPFIPNSSEKLANLLNKDIKNLDSAEKFNVESGHKIQEPDILFKKVEISEDKEVKKDMVSFEDFQKLDMRVGRIEEIQDIEESDNLYKLQIDVGGETKQSVAGMKGSYSPEDLESSKVPVLVNLEPSEVMGVKSECMILAAVEDETPILLRPDQDVDVGAEIE